MKPFFIIGTDTGVGKTHFALRYIAYNKGVNSGAVVYKPFASGVENDKELGLVNADVLALARAAGKAPSEVNYLTFERPLAPACAAIIEKRVLDYESALNWCRSRIAYNAALEGIGGALVPLTESAFVLDFAVELALPVVIVARAGLGTINHTMLTVEAVRSAHLPIAKVIVSMESPDIDETCEAGYSYLSRNLAPLPVRILPHIACSEPLDDAEESLFNELEERLSRMS
jgi:dethiobiotin synthetase